MKRGSESLDTTHRPSKKRRLFDDEDYMDWLEHEVDGIKNRMMQIADLRSEVDSKLDEILYEVQQSDGLSNFSSYWSSKS